MSALPRYVLIGCRLFFVLICRQPITSCLLPSRTPPEPIGDRLVSEALDGDAFGSGRLLASFKRSDPSDAKSSGELSSNKSDAGAPQSAEKSLRVGVTEPDLAELFLDGAVSAKKLQVESLTWLVVSLGSASEKTGDAGAEPSSISPPSDEVKDWMSLSSRPSPKEELGDDSSSIG